MTGEMASKKVLQFFCGDLISLSLSVRICLGLRLDILAFLVHVLIIATLSSSYYLCHFASLYKFCQHPPHRISLPSPYTQWPNSNDFHETNSQKLMKIINYQLARLVSQKLIDNLSLALLAVTIWAKTSLVLTFQYIGKILFWKFILKTSLELFHWA